MFTGKTLPLWLVEVRGLYGGALGCGAYASLARHAAVQAYWLIILFSAQATPQTRDTPGVVLYVTCMTRLSWQTARARDVPSKRLERSAAFAGQKNNKRVHAGRPACCSRQQLLGGLPLLFWRWQRWAQQLRGLAASLIEPGRQLPSQPRHS
jgi:hypothetical protein